MAKLFILTAVFLLSVLVHQSLGDCTYECQKLSYSSGKVIGTGPFCNGRCSECGSDSKCLDYWSEGAGCWTGSKACCCRGYVAPTTTAPRGGNCKKVAQAKCSSAGNGCVCIAGNNCYVCK